MSDPCPECKRDDCGLTFAKHEDDKEVLLCGIDCQLAQIRQLLELTLHELRESKLLWLRYR